MELDPVERPCKVPYLPSFPLPPKAISDHRKVYLLELWNMCGRVTMHESRLQQAIGRKLLPFASSASGAPLMQEERGSSQTTESNLWIAFMPKLPPPTEEVLVQLCSLVSLSSVQNQYYICLENIIIQSTGSGHKQLHIQVKLTKISQPAGKHSLTTTQLISIPEPFQTSKSNVPILGFPVALARRDSI